MNLDSWVDGRVATLEPAPDWRPNVDRALAQLRARGQSRRIGRAPLLRVACAIGVPLLLLLVAQVVNLRRIGNPPAEVTDKPPKAVVLPTTPPPLSSPPVAKAAPPKPVVPRRSSAAKNFKESGSPDAPITLELFLDYECPHCAVFYREVVPPLIAQYVQTRQVRLLHRDLPLRGHQYAALAARYANAAGQAGYYDVAVDQLFKTMAIWSRDGKIDAQLAGVLPSAAMRQVLRMVAGDPDLDATVNDDRAVAHGDQLTFVPAVVLVAKSERHVLGRVATFGELKTQIDLLLGSQNAGNPTTLDDFKAGDAIREAWDQRAADIVKAVQAAPGDWVADVGAGAGYYSTRLSSVVGPAGKVFAEDISDASIGWLKRRVALFDLPNVEIVKGAADDPKLPAGSLAAVLVVNSYHHFEQYQAMAAQVLSALKPGGRLVIADYSLPAHRAESRVEQLKRHEIDPALVRSELEQAGFEVLQIEDPFLKHMPEFKNAGTIATADMWLLIARK